MAATPTSPAEIAIEDIERAAATVAPLVRRTPVLAAGELSRRFGAPVALKAECLQRTGSFKIRGAANAIAAIPPDRLSAGVCAASAGNHAQAVTTAAARHGAHAELFMPVSAPLAKVAAVRGHGGNVRLVDGAYDEAQAAALEYATQTGTSFVHAFDNRDVVAGQGTVALEIAEQAPATRLIVVPLGGGGLAAGVGIAAAARLPGARVVGVQAEACAPYPPSLQAHRPIGARGESTICDGIAVKQPGELTLPLVARYLDEVVTVSDDEVAEAMVLLLERSKLVVEGAGAVAVAAILHGKVAPPADGETCAVLSGGNVDASRLAECIRLGETAAGRRMVLVTVVPDRPGALAGLLRCVAEEGANVIDVTHLREGLDLHIRETVIRLVLQTDGREHGERVLGAIQEHGFDVHLEDSALGGERRDGSA
ncbi:MAG: threonine dehydratase [Solirubrobacterales bacterium]|nr:threonine dehydratase [Solirubrobacterales bacterium]